MNFLMLLCCSCYCNCCWNLESKDILLNHFHDSMTFNWKKSQYTHSYTKRTVRSTHLCTLREVLCGCCSCCAFIDTEKKEERVWEQRLFIIYINIGMSVIFIVTIIISIKLLFKHNSTIYSISDCVNKSDLKMCIT